MPRPPQAASTLPPMSRGRARRIASRHVGTALLLSAAMVLGGVLLYLWPQVRLLGMGYRYSKLLAQRTQVLQRQKELQVELSSLRQLRRIEDIATQHLGLFMNFAIEMGCRWHIFVQCQLLKGGKQAIE